MIGQIELLNQLNTYTIDTLPHSILVIGEEGGGKKTFINQLANQFNLELIDLTKNITAEDCLDICLNANKCAYTIDCDKINKLYKILKILEEPSLNAYFILYTTNEDYLESTILDRCVKFKFKPYTSNELKTFSSKTLSDKAYLIARTPGQLLRLDDTKINSIIPLVDNIVQNIHKASIANALTISKKFNYKAEDYDGIDIDLFLNYLEYSISRNNPLLISSIINYKKDLLNKKLDRKSVMESFIIDLWERAHEINGIETSY